MGHFMAHIARYLFGTTRPCVPYGLEERVEEETRENLRSVRDLGHSIDELIEQNRQLKRVANGK